MADIKDQLIKDSYNYVLQSDLSTGVVYRIGGSVPVNPIFSSGLTVNSGFTYSNGTEQAGYALLTDGTGYAYWGPVSGASPSSGVTSITVGNGLSANSSTGAVTIVFTGSTSASGDYLPLSGGTVTGGTIFQSGLTANTISATSISATTYYGLPVDVFVTGGTYSNGTLYLTNNTGHTFNIPGFSTATGNTNNYYGSFSDTTTQVVNGADTPTAWSANTTEISNGIYIVDGSKITVSNDGIYEIGYSAQIEKTQGVGANVTIWAKINGNNVARSSSTISLVNNSVYSLPFVSYIFDLYAGDQVEFYFSSPSDHVQITTLSGLTTPTRPVSPSLIIVAKAIGNAVLSNSGDSYVTGFTLTNNNLILSQNRIGQYSGFTVNLPYLNTSGGTITGNLSVTGTTSSGTISATTYQNLPSQSGTGVSSLSYTSTNGILTLTKNDLTTLTAGTFTYLTGASYSNNVVTLTNNLGSSSTFTINTVTGFTINGGLTVTGNTSLQGLTATTISATTYQNLPFSGTVTGNGTSNYIPKWTGTTGLSNSLIYDDGTNVGIGTVSPSARLDILTPSSSTIGLRVSGDSTTDLFRITQTGSGNAILVEDDTNPDSTPFVVAADGRVGIGITAPLSSYKLHVRNGTATNSAAAAGTVATFEGSGATYVTVLSPDASNSGFAFGSNSDRFGAFAAWNYNNNQFSLNTDKTGGFISFSTDQQTERMRIDSSGNIGIGTTSPSAKVDINVSTGGTIGVRISGDSSSDMLRITQTGSGNAIVVEDSSNPDSTPFVVTSGGTIGIGTTSPQYFLEAVTTGGVDAVMLFDGGTAANSNLAARADTTQKVPVVVMSDRNNVYGVSTSFYIGLDRSPSSLFAGRNDSIYVNNYTDKGHYFVTANSSGTKAIKLSILGSGNVGIGTISPSEKLHVSGNTIISSGLTATTISATTYQNLPVSGLTGVSGISVSNSSGNFTIAYTGSTGGTFTGGTVSGATNFTGGLTANTISATTYQNLPFSGTVTGSGTADTIPKWNGSNSLTDSQITDNGTTVIIPSLTVSTEQIWNVGSTDPLLNSTETLNPILVDQNSNFLQTENEGYLSYRDFMNNIFFTLMNKSDHRAIQIFYSIRSEDDLSYRSGTILSNWDSTYSTFSQTEYGPSYYFNGSFSVNPPRVQYNGVSTKLDIYVSGTSEKVTLRLKYVLL